MVVVGSGRGGAGTSVVAGMLALSAAALDRRVLLVDADEHVGPQRWLMGVAAAAPHAPGFAALRGGLALDALLLPVSATLTLVPGGAGADAGALDAGADAPDAPPPLDPAERRALLRRVVAGFGTHDLVVVDGGSRLDAVAACVDVAVAAGLAPRLLVVAGADPIALAASYALVKAVAARAPQVEAEVLVNRADADAARLAHAQLDQAARHFLDRPLRLAGAVPEDGSLDLALRAGMPLVDAAADSPAAVAVQPIAARLAGAPAAPAARPVPPPRPGAAR